MYAASAHGDFDCDTEHLDSGPPTEIGNMPSSLTAFSTTEVGQLCRRIDSLLQQRLEEHAVRLERWITKHNVDMASGTKVDRISVAPVLGVSESLVTGEGRQDTFRGSLYSADEKTTEKTEAIPSVDAVERVCSSRTTIPWKQKSREVHEPSRFTSCVRGFNFELFWIGAIFTYAIVVGAQAHCAAIGYNTGSTAWMAVNWAYYALFLVEFLLRISAEGCGFFVLDSNGGWNFFDLFMVVCSTIEFVFDLVLFALKTSGTNPVNPTSTTVRIIRVVRVTRLIRIIRIVRIVRFVRGLRTLIYSILFTLRSLIWAMLLLALIMYVFGVVFTQAIADHMLALEVNQSESIYTEFWGSLPRAMLTLWASVSNGVDWSGRPLSHLQDAGWPWATLYIFYICFCALAVMNVVTAVFCHSAIEGAQHDSEMVMQEQLHNRSKFLASVRDIFETIDEEGSGVITLAHLEERMSDPSLEAKLTALELDPSDSISFFKLLATSDSNYIDWEDFLMGCTRLKGPAKAIHLAQLIHESRKMRHGLARFMRAVVEPTVQEASGTRFSRHQPETVITQDTIDSSSTRFGRQHGSIIAQDTIDTIN